MTRFTAPEDGLYALDPEAPGGARKVDQPGTLDYRQLLKEWYRDVWGVDYDTISGPIGEQDEHEPPERSE